MRTKLLLLLLFLPFSALLFSQQYIFGKVISEFGHEVENAVILNARTDAKTLTDKNGNYMIQAAPADEIRIVKAGYERFSLPLSPSSFSAPVNAILQKSAFVIPEIELAFQATGNLKKDIKRLDAPQKVVALNSKMDLYMRTPETTVRPKLSTPSAFATHNFSAGQVNVFALIGAAVDLLRKAKNPPPTTANYVETQAFYRQIKQSINLSFYTDKGWTEEDIDRFLIYADRFSELAKNYRKNFDAAAIDREMKLAYFEYIKTHKVGS